MNTDFKDNAHRHHPTGRPPSGMQQRFSEAEIVDE